MNAKRKKAEDFCIALVNDISGDTRNGDLYRNTVFPAMDDKQFEQWLRDLKAVKTILGIISPNGQSKISVKRNFAIAKKLGHEFFQQLWIEGDGDRPTYLTPPKYMILDEPQRRASQRQEKKISVPEHSQAIDFNSGQVTGVSKGASLSRPEAEILAGLNLQYTLLELEKYRGGDIGGGRVFNAMIAKLGSARLEILKHYATGVESKRMMKSILTAMMFRTTL